MVAESSELPVVIYNFPQMTKIPISPETIAKLAALPNIIGIKNCAGALVSMQRGLELTADADFAVMTGNPALGFSAYQRGHLCRVQSGSQSLCGRLQCIQ